MIMENIVTKEEIAPFATVFSKVGYCRYIRMGLHVGKGLKNKHARIYETLYHK